MASSGGNSSGSTQLQNNSGSEAELQDQRKRKRMQSNRESARRSRLRKQNHVDELMAQATQLKKENNQIMVTTNITTQNYMKVEAENSVLRAQMDELSQRLQSLNDILYYINSTAAPSDTAATASMDGVFDVDNFYGPGVDECLMNNNHPWNMMYLNQQQPIITSADHMLFQY